MSRAVMRPGEVTMRQAQDYNMAQHVNFCGRSDGADPTVPFLGQQDGSNQGKLKAAY